MENKQLAIFDDGILKPHNQAVYLKMLDGLLYGNKILVEQATGTGKSFLAMKYIHDYALNNGKKVLFVAPTKVIEDAFLDNCATILDYGKNNNYNIDLTTSLYAGLKNEVNNKYDIIILDEVHRSGAEVWGQNVQQLLDNNPDATVLGLTATLDRADGVDIRQYFDNREPVSRITLIDAIEQKILPAPDYTLAKVDFSDDSEFIEKTERDLMEKTKHATREEKARIVKHLADLNEAKKIISNSRKLPAIFAEELNTPELRNGKFIVFCIGGQTDDEQDNLLLMEQMAVQSHFWFKDVEGHPRVLAYPVHSTYGDEFNAEQIEQFERNDIEGIKLLFSVNMLNEGKHVEDIDGVIMFRPTSSKTIYLQQLGRALSVGHNDHPKIFDFVANLNMERIAEIKAAVSKPEKSDINQSNGESTDEQSESGKPIFNIDIKNLKEIEFINLLKNNIYELNENYNSDIFISHLQEYKQEYGNLLVPFSYKSPDGYGLGYKVSHTRGDYKAGRLSQERIDCLNEMGFVWDASVDQDKIFNTAISYLQEYKQEYGNLLVPRSYESGGYKLGQKVNAIRRYYKAGRLTQEQIDQLNAMGFVWEIRDKDRIFEEFINHLQVYKNEFGDLIVPRSYESTDGYKLGQKVSGIRKDFKAGRLAQERIGQLNAMGFVWDVSDNIYAEFINYLQEYKREYGNLLVPQRYKSADGYKLGNKVNATRADYKAGRLTQEQIDQLNEMGFVWSVERTKKATPQMQ